MINKLEVIAECPFENRQRCGELMSKLMIQSGAGTIKVPMKCDVEKFFYWYGTEELEEEDNITKQQYEDYTTKGIYKSREEYENKEK